MLGRVIATRKRILRGLCFYTCLSAILFTGGGSAWGGGLHRGAYIRGGGWADPHFRILRDTVNERAVRIELECILVENKKTCLCISMEHNTYSGISPGYLGTLSLITVLISAGESEKVNLLHIMIYQSVALAWWLLVCQLHVRALIIFVLSAEPVKGHLALTNMLPRRFWHARYHDVKWPFSVASV